MRTIDSVEILPPLTDVQARREKILVEIKDTIDEFEDMAGEADQPVARLLYSWGATKYRIYLARFEAAESYDQETQVIADMYALSQALELTVGRIGNPLGSPRLSDIREAAKNAKSSTAAEESLRADLSVFLVRHVQDIIQETEDSLARWRRSTQARPTPQEVRKIFLWHATRVLDLLQLLPGCDVSVVTDQIDQSINLIQRHTVKQLQVLSTDEYATLHWSKNGSTIELTT